MKLTCITYHFPWPKTHGGAIAQLSFLQHAQHLCHIQLVAVAHQTISQESVAEIKKILPKVELAFVSEKEPLPMSTSIPTKTLRLVEKTLNFLSYRIKKINKSTKITLGAEQAVASIVKVKTAYFVNQLSIVVSRFNPDIIQIDFVNLLDAKFWGLKPVPLVFVHHEIIFERLATKAAQNSYSHYLQQFAKTQEIAFLNSFDGVVVFSDVDKRILSNNGVTTSIVANPFSSVVSAPRRESNNKQLFNRLVFIGPELHYPNYEAVLWWANVISKTEAVNGQQLEVIGKWSEKTVTDLRSTCNIKFLGFVDDLALATKDAILLLPLRTGSGIRTKVLDALALRIPIISTAKGIEGIPLINGVHFLLAETPEDFAQAISRVKSQGEFSRNMVETAYSFFCQHYDAGSLAEQRLSWFQQLAAND
jgi:glycosyltransferase involved in cell wall biosynthesis